MAGAVEAYDKRGELPYALSVLLSQRRHAHDDVHVALDHLDEHGVQVSLVDRQARMRHQRIHLLEDNSQVVIIEEVGHLACGEDVVHIFKEHLLSDLSVDEQEDHRFELHASQLEDCLEILGGVGRSWHLVSGRRKETRDEEGGVERGKGAVSK